MLEAHFYSAPWIVLHNSPCHELRNTSHFSFRRLCPVASLTVSIYFLRLVCNVLFHICAHSAWNNISGFHLILPFHLARELIQFSGSTLLSAKAGTVKAYVS